MPRVEISTATVFRSPTRKRRFFTLEAACYAEAAAMMREKYPDERDEIGPNGENWGGGWNWRADDYKVRAVERLARWIERWARMELEK